MTFAGPAEDLQMIREAIKAYADAVNRRDAGDWGALWARDARWILPDYPERGDVQGREAIVQTWIAAMELYPGIVFTTDIEAIEVTGARATARSTTAETYDDAAGRTRHERGCYEDVLIKQDGRWLFERRTFRNTHRE